MFVVAMGSMLTTIMLNRSVTELLVANRSLANQQAFHLAEAGMDDAIVTLRAFLTTTGSPPAQLLQGTTELTMGQSTFRIVPDPKNAASFIDYFTIEASGTLRGLTRPRRLTGLFRTESFARYAYFTNFETMRNGQVVWFSTSNTVEGPLHTNGQLNISNAPTFNGPVSSVAASINYMHGGPPSDAPNFQQSVDLGVPPIQMPTSLEVLKNAASNGGLRLSGDTTLRLDGTTVFVTNSAKGWTEHPMALPGNQTIFVDGNVVVGRSTLNGQLTVGSSQDITVSDWIEYRCNPEAPQADADCLDPVSGTAVYNDDLMGLVAEHDVKVSPSAPFDMHIQASIMAVEGSFFVEAWNIGSAKGTLHVFGGITQNYRGPVGTFNPMTGVGVSGYRKDYHYDSRLRNLSPPFYPTTGRFESVIWQDQ